MLATIPLARKLNKGKLYVSQEARSVGRVSFYLELSVLVPLLCKGRYLPILLKNSC